MNRNQKNNPIKYCSGCGTELVSPDNWYPCYAKSNRYTCRKCQQYIAARRWYDRWGRYPGVKQGRPPIKYDETGRPVK